MTEWIKSPERMSRHRLNVIGREAEVRQRRQTNQQRRWLIKHWRQLVVTQLTATRVVTRWLLAPHNHSHLPRNIQSSISLHHGYTHPFKGHFSRTTEVGRYQKGKTNLDFTKARDSEWQWHQLVHVQVCTSLQTDNHASTSPLSFLQAGCPSCRPTNSIKTLKAFLFCFN